MARRFLSGFDLCCELIEVLRKPMPITKVHFAK